MKTLRKVFHVGGKESHSYVIIELPETTTEIPSYVIDTQSVVTADPDLVSAVAQANGIQNFMKKIAEGNAVNGINLDKLNKMCNDNPKNVTYLGDNVRQNEKHEWIPCNYSLNVINRAANKEQQKNLAWIDLQNELRSDTKDIIFKPNKAQPDDTIDPTKKVMQGHSGALYGKRLAKGSEFIPLTKGQIDFHNELRSEFVKNTTIPECIENLQKVSNSWVWDGTGTPSQDTHHNEYYRSQTGGTPYKLADLEEEQKKGYTRINTMYGDLKKKYADKK
jgi:hypothetical protein